LDLDAARVRLCVNSDDPAGFGVNLTQEMTRLMGDRGVSVDDLARWSANNALDNALIDPQRRTEWLTELETWRQASNGPENCHGNHTKGEEV
jgi:adenosine deaminase